MSNSLGRPIAPLRDPILRIRDRPVNIAAQQGQGVPTRRPDRVYQNCPDMVLETVKICPTQGVGPREVLGVHKPRNPEAQGLQERSAGYSFPRISAQPRKTAS